MSKKWKQPFFRMKVSLSQSDLADYLGVSQGLVAQWEMGKRGLPGDAFKKIAALEMDFEEHGKATVTGETLLKTQNITREEEGKLAVSLLNKVSLHRPKADKLEKQLVELNKKYEDLQAWVNYVDSRLDSLPVNNSTEGERQWLSVQQASIPVLLLRSKNNISRLVLQIELLRAVAEIHERHAIWLRKRPG